MTTGQYHVVRFAPDPVRDEPLNIGLVMVGEFPPLVDFPDEALERAARWCRGLDQAGLVAMRATLVDILQREVAMRQDIDRSLREDILGELFGPITISEPRWVDVEAPQAPELFRFLTDRLVNPPRPVAYGGGAPASKKIAKAILPQIRRWRPNARMDEQLAARSGRPFTAEVYAGGEQPLVVSTLALGSNWQAVRAVEAKAFELYDVGRSLHRPSLVACCDFPDIDPEGIQEQAHMVFDSIDVRVATPDTIGDLAAVAR